MWRGGKGWEAMGSDVKGWRGMGRDWKGWEGMGRVGKERDGMGWDGMGWGGIGWGRMACDEFNSLKTLPYRSIQSSQSLTNDSANLVFLMTSSPA